MYYEINCKIAWCSYVMETCFMLLSLEREIHSFLADFSHKGQFVWRRVVFFVVSLGNPASKLQDESELEFMDELQY